MCLIKFRPVAEEEEEPTVSSRPLTALHRSAPPSRARNSPPAHLTPNPPQTSPSQYSPGRQWETSAGAPPPQQVIIIQQCTSPLASGVAIPEEGLKGGHPDAPEKDRQRTAPGQSHGQRKHRRNSSAGGKGLGPGPRVSTASHRSTRERIVVVDSEGSKRKYYR